MRNYLRILIAGFAAIVPLGATGGEAEIGNARLAIALEKSDGSLTLLEKAGGKTVERARIAAIAGETSARFDSLEQEAAGGGEAVAVAVAKGTAGAGIAVSLRVRLSGDRPIVECGPGAGVSGLSISYLSSHAMLPEVFGDDLVLRAGEAEASPLYLPAEHAVLHPLEGGDALLLVSWPPAPKEVAVHVAKGANGPRFVRTQIACAGEKVWISLLAGKAIWREFDASGFTFSEYRKLDWKPPFLARYRFDLRKDGPWGLTDSWRRRTTRDKFWMAFLSNGYPPLQISAEEAFVRLPRFRLGLPSPKSMPQEIKFSGPIIVYPFDRETESEAGKTPEGAWTVLDAVRAALGDGWESALDIGEGVLRAEPFPKGFVFVATCGATGIAEGLFSKGEEKKEAATIRRAFADMVLFVRYHRVRIGDYVDFAAAWSKKIEEYRKARGPSAEIDKALADLGPILQYIPDLFEASRDAIKTPEYCQELTEKAIALIDSQDPEKVKRVKELGVAMRTIGGRQDDMMAAYRIAVKSFRQRAGQIHATAQDAGVRELLRDLRKATLAALRICSPYEEFLFLTAAHVVEKQ